jgi:hypothetical protein
VHNPPLTPQSTQCIQWRAFCDSKKEKEQEKEPEPENSGGSFFSQLKESLKKGIEDNKEIQDAISELKQTSKNAETKMADWEADSRKVT